MTTSFWKGKTVFITGHTGFKGSWLTLLLTNLGARVVGYSLSPATEPNLFTLAKIEELCDRSYIGDIRDLVVLRDAMQAAKPDIVMHLAAQPLVRQSYTDPVGTYSTNVMGTVNVLEAVRATPSVRACLVITSDKCYENQEWHYAYRESDALGGYDPYSNSKACAELVVSAYRRSFFLNGVSVATARAGNVIGGGDWAEDRLVPDAMKAFSIAEPFVVRHPDAIRPWQHVLEPLMGYLALVERQWNKPEKYADAFNFGPHPHQQATAGDIAQLLVRYWGDDARFKIVESGANAAHEAGRLILDISRTCARLDWKPRFDHEQAISRTVNWYKGIIKNPEAARELCNIDINAYNEIL
ncbi:CDP-glucose 4,6-dehydratase [Candidatus Kaiserbacteria bacterium RIFCSPHIGHO2_01_FULL_46_22]|uniref:CDP-glucose 4,6-dehydratase n=1 Tax=Candidatus Kaiserbacteria bacterium RIFCSPHIGHO2_01_FULL_46_22 TaxID=1798475 RepID=A0A1F6BXW1_9BACT|nr:MAG: CDP-glucose 4,6-dehydratase [Candidatus Kaiserbacteria bacterium RIFCSPHIGHO2_01_FULL_46_22]